MMSRGSQSAKKQLSLTKRLGRTIIGAFAIALLLIFSEGEIGGALYTNNQKDTQIIAHRAGAAFAPENTLAALEAAISAALTVLKSMSSKLRMER